MKLSVRARINITVGYCAFYLLGWASPSILADFYRDDMVNAARNGDAKSISFLLALGADPSRVGWEEHLTPLGAAAQAGHADIVALLLRKGARVNEPDDHHETALNHAHDTESIKLLKAAGGIEYPSKHYW